jgi:hypothetical protein
VLTITRQISEALYGLFNKQTMFKKINETMKSTKTEYIFPQEDVIIDGIGELV